MLTAGKEDVTWFNTNKAQLLKKYEDCFIAFHNKKIIDADKDLDKLLKKLSKRGINTHNTFIEFLSKVKHIL